MEKQRDQAIWDIIIKLYNSKNLEESRKKNQEIAYWCPPNNIDKDAPVPHLFTDTKQRLMARFVKSYLNTAWHKIQSKEKPEQENWFSQSNIIDIIRSIPDSKDNLIRFSKKVLMLLNRVELKDYGFNELQEDSFKALSYAADEYMKALKNADLPKSQRVSEYEEKIFEQAEEPYRTILKMQKVLPGFGIALTCDFLKESHLCNIAKPDVHLCHVFSVIDKIQYSMDLVLVRRIAEFAEHVGLSPKSNDFCNSGSYYIDKIIWMLCSNMFKNELMQEIAKIQ